MAQHVPSIAQRLHLPPQPPALTQATSPSTCQFSQMPVSGQTRTPKLNPLKQLVRYVSAIFKLGRTEQTAKQALRTAQQGMTTLHDTRHQFQGLADDIRRDMQGGLGDLNHDVKQVWQSITQLERAHERHAQQFEVMRELLKTNDAAAARAISDVCRRLDLVMLHGLPAQGAAATPPAAFTPAPYDSEGFRAFKDSFYHRLENRYRGAPEEISNRLRIYLPDVEAASIRTNGKPAMDIGCGRGEWLGLLRKAGISAFGVDTNPVQIEEARRDGLDVRLGDALAFLAQAEDNSLSVLTAHHLVEHLPFDMVAWITREAMRVLAPGGLLLFETPNTRNVLVGATTFHTDPTHIKPMPEQVLGTLFDTAGYDPVEIRHLHPHERLGEFLARPDFSNELARLLFGPQDLAVLGTRPAGE